MTDESKLLPVNNDVNNFNCSAIQVAYLIMMVIPY